MRWANFITLCRMLLALGQVATFHLWRRYLVLGSLGLTIAVIVLDAVDGWVARRTRTCTPAGAAFDTAADRVVENLYWVFFAATGLLSFWVPVIVATRGVLTDRSPSCRAWSQVLYRSRWSRALYGTAKALTFSLLSLELAGASAAPLLVHQIADGLVVVTVSLCLLRGLPALCGTLTELLAIPAPAEAVQ